MGYSGFAKHIHKHLSSGKLKSQLNETVGKKLVKEEQNKIHLFLLRLTVIVDGYLIKPKRCN